MKYKKRNILTSVFLLLLIMSSFLFANISFAEVKGTDINGVEIGYGLGKKGISNYSEEISTLVGEGEDGGLGRAGNHILTEYKTAIAGVTGMIALTFIIFFLINFAKLGQSAGNPQLRQSAMMGIIWCGIAAMCTGGVSIFFAFFYNFGANLE